MEQYIPKAAVVAEVEKIIADETESIKFFEHSKNVSEVQRSNARISILEHMRSLLDTLEVKEVQEEPVSEDLEEAAENYGIRQGTELKPFAIKYFKAGAKWKEEQFEKDYADLCNGIATAKGIAVTMAYDKGMADARKAAVIAREEAIKEVCEWIENNVVGYCVINDTYDVDGCIEDLKKHFKGKL